MKPHTRFRIALVKEINEIPDVAVIVMQAGSIRGWQDLIICAGGHFVAAEVKIPPDKQSALQKLRSKQVKWAGGKSFVVTPKNKKKFLKTLRLLAEQPVTMDI